MLSACNVVDELQDMVAQQEQLSREVSKEFGMDAVVGWNINNGILTQITVSFQTDKVITASVSEIQEKVEKLVHAKFDKKPKIIIVQFIKTQN